jgi:hypothetical protein
MVEQLEDRITPSFTTSLQQLIAGANQIRSLGSTVASATALLDNIPLFGQQLDHFVGVVDGYARLGNALPRVQPTIDNAPALEKALNSTGLGPFTVTLRNRDENQIFITFARPIPSAALTIGGDTASFTAGKLAYLAQVSASGSGTLTLGNSSLNLTIGTDGHQLVVPEERLVDLVNPHGEVATTGTATIAGNAFRVRFSGTAVLEGTGLHVDTRNRSHPGQLIPLTQVAGNLTFGAGLDIKLFASVTASVLGIDLVQWGSPPSGDSPPTPLFWWTTGEISQFGQARINYGTVRYLGDSARQQVESRLFSFLTRNILGVVGADLNVGGIQVEDLQKVGELVTLLQIITGNYDTLLSGGGRNFTRDGQPAANFDYGFQPDLFPQTSSTRDRSSPFHFQQDPASLLAFAQGQPVDLVWYSYQGKGPSFGEDIPVASYSWWFLGDMFKIDLSGIVSGVLASTYMVRFGLDTNGLFVDTSQTGVQITLSTTGSLNLDVKFLEFVGVADARLGLDLTAGVNFGLNPTRGTKIYLQDLVRSADVSGYSTSGGIPAALNGVASWLRDRVYADFQPSRSQIFFSIGLNNPAQSVADAFFSQLPPGVADDLREVAARLGIGEKIQNLTEGLTKTVENVCHWEVIKDILEVIGQKEVCESVVHDVTATFGGNMIPLVDRLVEAVGITPGGVHDFSVPSLAAIPATYRQNNPNFPADPPNGIWHYSIPGLGLSRAEYTWSWAVNVQPRRQPHIYGGSAPNPDTSKTDPITYGYDPDTGTLVITGTAGDDVIEVRPDGKGNVILTRANSTDGGKTFTFAPIVVLPKVTSVTVNGGGGNDRITIDPSLTIPTTINAGPGHNVILTGSGNNHITGNGSIETGNGNNTISTTGAVVHAGNGNNTITATNSVVFTGTGNNTIIAGGNNKLHPGTGHTTFQNMTATDQYIHSPTATGRYDFFGPDGKPLGKAPSGIGVYEISTARWLLRNELSSGNPDAGDFRYGGPGLIPITGDWNGDGVFTPGVYEISTGRWLLRDENSAGRPDAGDFFYGGPGLIPITGDWSGTGKTGIGVYEISTGRWLLKNTPGNGRPDFDFFYGGPGLIPVTGDWNHSGRTSIGVYEIGTGRWLLRNTASNGAPDAGDFSYGGPGLIPFGGNWKGDGKAGIGVYEIGTGRWLLRYETSAGNPDAGDFSYGGPGLSPLAGHYAFAEQTPQGRPGGATLDPADLQPVVAAALIRLMNAGVNSALVQRLATAQFVVGTLPGGTLGFAYPDANQVLISIDAAGDGWFVDPSPLPGDAAAGEVVLPGNVAGRQDLLTVVLHEMGHLAGLLEQEGSEAGVMSDTLGPGLRHTGNLGRVFSGLR